MLYRQKMAKHFFLSDIQTFDNVLTLNIRFTGKLYQLTHDARTVN